MTLAKDFKQVDVQPGRCDVPPSQIITDYRLSQKRSIFAGDVFDDMCTGRAKKSNPLGKILYL